MVGQKSLLTIIDEQIFMDELPKFMIITGAEGSGKKLLAEHICTEANFFWCFEPDNKIDTVRKVIAESYKVTSPTCYIFADVDTMSVSGKNALLKITEETPRFAHIIVTVTDLHTLPATLKSRASIYYMSPYTPVELLEYAKAEGVNIPVDIIKELCETPKDVNILASYGAVEFYDFVAKVVDNIAEVTTANALKVTEKLGLKGESTKYDPKLFLRAFKAVCGHKMKQAIDIDDVESQMYYSTAVKLCSNTLNQLNITGINKGALMDLFILDIREEWA